MAIATSGSIDEVLSRSAHYASSGSTDLSTGHILLAVLTGTGTAAKTLSLRGLSETAVRNAIRESATDDSKIVKEVIDKARQYARTLNVSSPSALHLLASLATVKRCQANGILRSAGLDVDIIRNQALRNMTTALTREHGAPQERAARRERGTNAVKERLPLHEQLKLEDRGARPQPAPERQPRRPERKIQAPGDVGRSLEQAQLKTRRLRASTSSTSDTRAVEPPRAAAEPAIAEERVAPAIPIRDMSYEARFQLSPKEFPILSSIGRNLTVEALLGNLDEIIGRTREMEQMADVLNKRKANSPCLVGPPGVGKTAVVEGLALKLARDEAPGLEDRILIEVRPADILTGTSLRGALSERLSGLMSEVSLSDGKVILFFDEIHALLGSNDGAEAVQELKAALGRGELPCIAATTGPEYTRQVEADPALARRFTVIDIEEPSGQEALEILRGIEPSYAEHHDVGYAPEAVEAAVKLSSRYLSGRALPDKAVALLDLAGARTRRSGNAVVVAEDIAAVLAEQIGVPARRLGTSDADRLLELEERLAEQIIGHGEAMAAIGETLRRNAAGFRSGRPIGSFLFLGPTGVGKTETAKALADLLFLDRNAMVRLDMTEFAEPHAVARLVGAPPGYIGHEDGGQLTEAVSRRPYSLVLLDEVEKAHRDVIQILLQVLDDGRLTDGKGKTVSFENTVIVMTSNLGSDLREIAPRRRAVGFARDEEAGPRVEDVQGAILDGAREALAPELWNRIDEPLVFAPLSREEVSQIASLMLLAVCEQLDREHGISLAVGDGAVETLVDSGGYDPDLGARPMRRTVQRMVEAPIARMVLGREIVTGDVVEITGDGSDLSFEAGKPVD